MQSMAKLGVLSFNSTFERTPEETFRWIYEGIHGVMPVERIRIIPGGILGRVPKSILEEFLTKFVKDFPRAFLEEFSKTILANLLKWLYDKILNKSLGEFLKESFSLYESLNSLELFARGFSEGIIRRVLERLSR